MSKLFVLTNINCIRLMNALERIRSGLQIITNYDRIANVINLVQRSEYCTDAEDIADEIEEGNISSSKVEHMFAPRIMPVSLNPKPGDAIKIPIVGDFGIFAVENPSEYDIDDRFASLVIGGFATFTNVVEINVGTEISEELPEERHRNPSKYIKTIYNFGFSQIEDYEDRFEIPRLNSVEVANKLICQNKADFYELHPLMPQTSPFVALVFSANSKDELLTEIAKLDLSVGYIVSYCRI